MKKKSFWMTIVLYTLSLIVILVSCNNINEEDFIGTYTETHECFKDSIWLLPNGVFMQKVYGRKGKLIYDKKSTWRFNCGKLSIDCIYTLPPACENVDTLYPHELQGGIADMKFSKKDGKFAIYYPVFVELDEGIYFYKISNNLE